MSQGKFNENLIRLKCSVCKHVNYTLHKNRKTVERKIEYKKFCDWCRKHTLHKEGKK
ncbi:MAG: 50S ribosomal protein L33 [Candidatus Jorgensenbacteria bacterium]|nr:50S ribosomal protein L33 [Candidatus Jorgensenbacteria bacterium]